MADLKEAGLYDEFIKRPRFDGENLIICDKKLAKYISIPPGKESFSVDAQRLTRSFLRNMLLDFIPEKQPNGAGTYASLMTTTIDQGTEGGFDPIVSADGAWSETRKLLLDQIPHYSGIGGITFTIPNAKHRILILSPIEDL